VGYGVSEMKTHAGPGYRVYFSRRGRTVYLVLCGGGGVFEFRPDRLMGMDERTPPQELDRVEYRGDAKRVVVLPKTTLRLIEFDVEGPDRINCASQKCVLVRVGAASSSASTPAPAATSAAAAAPSAAAAAGGVLAISVGTLSADKGSAAGRKFPVLKQDPQFALIRGGLKSTPYASVAQNWVQACLAKAPECEKGARALQPYIVGSVTTNANGHAQLAEAAAIIQKLPAEMQKLRSLTVWQQRITEEQARRRGA